MKINFINYYPYMALFFMYAFIDLNSILGVSIKKILQSNILLTYFIGFIGMYMFTMLSNHNQPPLLSLLLTIPAYCLFLINTRLNYIYIIPNIIIIMIIFTIDKTRLYDLENDYITDINSDKLEYIENILFIIFLLITFIGFINYYYFILKKNNKWSWKKFINNSQYK